MNKDRLYNMTCAKLTMCFDQYGFVETVALIAESVDDHIKDNLQRETDEAERLFFMEHKRKIEGLVK